MTYTSGCPGACSSGVTVTLPCRAVVSPSVAVSETAFWPAAQQSVRAGVPSQPFKLGQWGLIVNILGLVWGVAMEINFLWPRNASVGGQNPPLSALPNITIGSPLGDIPVFEFTLGLILLVGVIYWAIAQRKAPDTTVAPAGARASARLRQPARA